MHIDLCVSIFVLGKRELMEHEEQDQQHAMDLPPGFRFHPTDEELITHYLAKKVADARFAAHAVSVADLNKCEPWDLPCKHHAPTTYAVNTSTETLDRAAN